VSAILSAPHSLQEYLTVIIYAFLSLRSICILVGVGKFFQIVTLEMWAITRLRQSADIVHVTETGFAALFALVRHLRLPSRTRLHP
jgi:hypothetical protein